MITVIGQQGGREVVRFGLGHGADPAGSLLARGWAGRPLSVTRPRSDDLEIRYAVEPASDGARAGAEAADAQRVPRRGTSVSSRVAWDEDLTEADAAAAVRHQRVAAYGVVSSHRGLLLTELSERTNAAGRWNLPGGGIDPHESPEEAVLREVFEETGQRVQDIALLTVLSGHWVGRSPGGRVEDYHAVRVFHTATCPAPTDPVVHDVGGSTASGAWVRPERLGRLPLAGSVAEALRAAGLPA